MAAYDFGPSTSSGTTFDYVQGPIPSATATPPLQFRVCCARKNPSVAFSKDCRTAAQFCTLLSRHPWLVIFFVRKKNRSLSQSKGTVPKQMPLIPTNSGSSPEWRLSPWTWLRVCPEMPLYFYILRPVWNDGCIKIMGFLRQGKTSLRSRGFPPPRLGSKGLPWKKNHLFVKFRHFT